MLIANNQPPSGAVKGTPREPKKIKARLAAIKIKAQFIKLLLGVWSFIASPPSLYNALRIDAH